MLLSWAYTELKSGSSSGSILTSFCLTCMPQQTPEPNTSSTKEAPTLTSYITLTQ